MRLCLLSVIALIAVYLPKSGTKEVLSSLNCIPITECPVLYNLLKQKPVTSETITFIRTSHCGFEGMIEKVWCPDIIEVIEEESTFKSTLRSQNYTNQNIKSYYRIDTNEILDKENKGENEENVMDLFPENCGGTVEDKVFGGTETAIDEYPWIALLQYENRKSRKLYNGCGGILINKRYVLTAAHCVTLGNNPVRVVLGEYDTRNETDCVILRPGYEDCSDKPIKASIEEVHVHPEWIVKNRRPFYNDIALIRLSQEITFSDFVNPICLPSKNYTVPVNENLIVSGWGRTESRGPTYVKQQVSLPLVNSEECSRVVKKVVNEGQICAGGVAGKDACVGDSGGPLMSFDQEKGAWVAAGVVSLSLQGCGIEGVPGIYTFVPHYLEWIYSKVKP